MTKTATTGGIRPLYVVIIALIAFAAGAGVGVGVWIMISGGSGEPSQDVRQAAPTLSLGGGDAAATATPAGSGSVEEVPAVADAARSQRRSVPRLDRQQNPTPTPAPEATPEVTPEPAPPVAIPFARGLYRINPAASEVRFILQEDLRGQRIDVVGITQEVAGDVIVDFAAPTASQVGAIAINARTLATDNNFRNQALRGQILRSAEDAYEFITFTPTGLAGLPTAAVTMTGAAVTFQLTGDLTIIETTLPVTFDVTLGVDSLEAITGSATTVVNWRDFNITIPNVPGVANISDEVRLEIDFSAALVEAQGDAPVAADAVPFDRGLYRIDPTESEVRFILQEDLRGQRIDVIGTTREVAGDFIVDFVNPVGSQVGAIAINARTLATDNNFRNQALRGQILRSAEAAYEFITFTPTTLAGLPTAAVTAVGSSVTFQVTGDLTIIETTLPVTFDVTLTLDTPEMLLGTAATVVNWRDFNITIPDVPGVANITDEVRLEIDFLARLVDSQ